MTINCIEMGERKRWAGRKFTDLRPEVKTPRERQMTKAGGIGGIQEFRGYFADFYRGCLAPRGCRPVRSGHPSCPQIVSRSSMFSGSIVALVTPMKADGAVDNEALDRLVEFHVANGTNGIVAVGTTGESPTLSVEEHIGVVRRVVQRAAKRIPVIAGTGANSTHEAIELTQLAKEAGADACLMVTPYYNRPTQEGLFQHYKAVAERVSVPIVLYNVPSRTGGDIKPETVERLAA